MDHDKQLDEFLCMRPVPEARSNLEYRIIQASLQEEAGQNKNVNLAGGVLAVITKGIKAALDCVVLPHPALAMVMVLVCGAVLGLYSGSDVSVCRFGVSVSEGYSSSDVESFVMASDVFEYGDFL